MTRIRGLTVIELVIICVIIVVIIFIFFPALSRRGTPERKATCLSNIRQITLACIMYAQDYDEVLPACVADDENGTAHSATAKYRNWTMPAFVANVAAVYGAAYADGRWMWHLYDAIGPYTKGPDIMNCPSLLWRYKDGRFEIQRYVVGTDLKEPLLSAKLKAAVPPGQRKVWRSGSYTYMCMHHPYGRGARAARYGGDFMSTWDIARLLGYAGAFGSLDAVNPQQYLACGYAVGVFDNPVMKPLVMCRGLAIHEGHLNEYARSHMIPPELAPAFALSAEQVTPTIGIGRPVGFVDGHAKYWRGDFYDWLALVVSPNVFPKQP